MRKPTLRPVLIASSLLALAALLLPPPAAADIRTEEVVYRDGDRPLEGFFAWDDASRTPRPGVAVFHAWKGPGEFEREQARRLARVGYVAFVADVYGQGVRPRTTAEAAAEAGRYRGEDRSLIRRRARLALDRLRAHPLVAPERTGAIGFCFGGTAVLELARSGADVSAVVSFHGSLTTPSPARPGEVTARVLVLHGTVDPHAPLADVVALCRELDAAGVDYETDLYGGAVHAFTDPASGSDPSRGAAYDPSAARHSWDAMSRFFREVFAQPQRRSGADPR